MASLSINPGVVTYTLNQYSCGVNQADYAYGDFANQYYRSLCLALQPEIVRSCPLSRPMDYPAYANMREFHKYMHDNLGSAYATMLSTSATPTPFPNGPASAVTAAITSAAKYALADHQALFQDWVNYGIPVLWWQGFNEAPNNSFPTASAGNPYFVPSGVLAQEQCQDWETIRSRDAYNAYHTKIAAMGRTGVTKVQALDTASISNVAGYGYTKGYLLGTMSSGASNPNGSPNNIPFFDILGIHTYGGGLNSDFQSFGNAFFRDNQVSEANFLAEGPKAKWVAPFRWLRAILDANGGSAMTFSITEGGGTFDPNAGAPNALYDVAQAIVFCQFSNLFKIDHLLVHAYNRSDPSLEEFLLLQDDGLYNKTSEAAYLPGRRYYAFRDMWGRYMRTYKRQVQVTITSASSNTPGGNNSNPVPRIQAVAGLNADGSKMAIMMANIDLSAAEQVTFELGAVTQGQITGFSLPMNHPQILAPLPTIAPFGDGVSSFATGSAGAPAIAAGGSYLFEIPLSPGVSGLTFLGNWDASTQINAGAGSPPPPDQFSGNWSTAVQINANFPPALPEVIGTIPI